MKPSPHDAPVGRRILFLLFVLLWPGWVGTAGAVSFTDTTLVLKGNSWNDRTHGWVDVIPAGSVYEVFGMDVRFLNGFLALDLHTSYPGGPEVVSGSLVTHAADLFIDVGLDGAFDYAVALSGHDFNEAPVSAGTLYDVGAGTLMASSDYFEGNPVRNHYGEAWDNPWDGNEEAVPVPVAFDNGTALADTGLSWLATGGAGGPAYRLSLSIALSDLGAGGFAPLGLLWSPAHCANDVMAVRAVPSPEPATMFLVGTGLIGVAALGRRKMSRRKGGEMNVISN